MPIHRLRKGQRIYYRWGDHGTLYRTKRQAMQQMKAAFANGYRGRERPRQHVRRLRSGRHTVVNRGVHKTYGSWLWRQRIDERVKGDMVYPRIKKSLIKYLEKNPELVEKIGETPLYVTAPNKVEWYINPLKGKEPQFAMLAKGRSVHGKYVSSQDNYPRGAIEPSQSVVTGDIDAQPKLFGLIPLDKTRFRPFIGHSDSDSLNIGRTLRHELQHKQQDSEGRISMKSYIPSTTNRKQYHDQPIEQEARAAAHVIPERMTPQKLTTIGMETLNERWGVDDTPMHPAIKKSTTPKEDRAKIEAGMQGLFG